MKPKKVKEVAIRITDIFPLCYWLRTRFESLNIFKSLTFPFYFLINIGYLACVLLYFSQNYVQTYNFYTQLTWLITIWMAYLSIYEIGYFMNDFWSLSREQKRGESNHKQIAEDFNIFTLVLAIISRIILFSAILIHIKQDLPSDFFLYIIFTLILIYTTFIIHNIIFIPYRTVTFFFLYIGKYFLIAPFIINQANFFTLLAIIAAPSIGCAFVYSINKKVFKVNQLLAGISSSYLIMRTANIFLLMSIIISLVFSIEDTKLLFILVAYLLSVDICMIMIRFLSAIFKSLKIAKQRFHVHTSYSHDCDVNPEIIVKETEAQKIEKVYIQDHADTFDESKYKSLQKSFEIINKYQNCSFIVGLEYEVLNQHFLAVNLKKYLPIERNLVEDLQKLKSSSDSIVWAHPHFSIRKLTSPQYLYQLLEMMYWVDGLEWINLKSLRGFRFLIRHLLISFVAIALYGTKLLYVGFDAHTLDEWHKQLPIYNV